MIHKMTGELFVGCVFRSGETGAVCHFFWPLHQAVWCGSNTRALTCDGAVFTSTL